MEGRSIDTGSEDLQAVVRERVATLVLNRPERRNALSHPMLEALARALEDAEEADDVGAVVLTGAGGAFCAGGDVKEFAVRAAQDPATPDERARQVEEQRVLQRDTVGRLYGLSKPTLAVLPGPAAGAGLSLALACDLRLASRHAFLTTAFARVGLPGDFGGGWLLSRLVGSGRARELYLLSERVGADQALALGILNWVVEADELAERSAEIASRLARGPLLAYRFMKDNLDRAASSGLAEYMDAEAEHHIDCFGTEDHREAALAFVEGREPVFRGR